MLREITNNIVNPAHFDGQVHPKRLSIGLRSTTAIQAEEAAEPLANALAEEMFSLDRDRQFEEAILAREFAEAEVAASKKALLDSQKERSALETELSHAQDLCDNLRSEVEAAFVQYDTLKEDLGDALTREARQALSARELMAAHRELEIAYSEAMSLIQDQSETIRELDFTLEASVGGTGSTMDRIEEEDEEVEIVSIPDEQPLLEKLTSGEHDRSTDAILDYEIVDIEEFSKFSVGAHSRIGATARCRATIQKAATRLLHLPHKNRRSNLPSPKAIRLFAMHELEDEIQENKDALSRLCSEFLAVDLKQGRNLRSLHVALDFKLHEIRIGAAKLTAVKEFSD